MNVKKGEKERLEKPEDIRGERGDTD